MSYHDGYYSPKLNRKKDNSRSNYYDELAFWISRAKNLEILLTEAREHVIDFEMLLRATKNMNLVPDHTGEIQLEEIQRFLRTLQEALADNKGEST
jgi:hypothetical protein|tara:strand:+ start:1943 stop:2230 length:288 start_codon:yes stop_codon:yes gene_type:complete